MIIIDIVFIGIAVIIFFILVFIDIVGTIFIPFLYSIIVPSYQSAIVLSPKWLRARHVHRLGLKCKVLRLKFRLRA